jgi:colicin import membrane protein
MSGRRGDKWIPVVLSVLVHGAIVLLLGWSWWVFRHPTPVPQQLALEAQVIDSKTLARLTASRAPPRPAPEPLPAPEEPATPPQPDPAQVEAEHRAAQARRDEQAQQEAREKQARIERDKAERLEQQRAEAKARAEVERKAKAETERLAREAKAKQQAEAERQRREAELRAQMASEERINAARGSVEQTQYKALIEARITRAWIRPPTARAGISCEVRVTQVPGGSVVAVQVGKCNGDAAVRESIEAAVYRASPLPMPSNPDLFDRNLVVNFAPHD